MNNTQPKTARERAEQFAARHGLTIHRVHAEASNKFSFVDGNETIARATTYDSLLKRMERYVNARS